MRVIGNRAVEDKDNNLLLQNFFSPELERLLNYMKNEIPNLDLGIGDYIAKMSVPFTVYTLTKEMFQKSELVASMSLKNGESLPIKYLEDYGDNTKEMGIPIFRTHRDKGLYLEKFLQPIKEFFPNQNLFNIDEIDAIHKILFSTREEIKQTFDGMIASYDDSNLNLKSRENAIKFIMGHSTTERNLYREGELSAEKLLECFTYINSIKKSVSEFKNQELDRIYRRLN